MAIGPHLIGKYVIVLRGKFEQIPHTTDHGGPGLTRGPVAVLHKKPTCNLLLFCPFVNSVVHFMTFRDVCLCSDV